MIYSIVVIIVFLIGMGLVVHLLFHGKPPIEEEEEELVETTNFMDKVVMWLSERSDKLIVQFKILVAHFQILAGFPTLLRINYPETLTQVTESFSIFNMDFWGLLSSGCFFKSSFMNQLLFATLFPFAINLCLLLAYFWIVRQRRKCGDLSTKHFHRNSCLQGVLLNLFMFYVITSTTILQTFDCVTIQKNESTGETISLLMADLSVDCNSQYYHRTKIYAIIMTAIYPIGIPVIYAIALFVKRKKLNPKPGNCMESLEIRKKDEDIAKYSFLWSSYKPRAYYFEVWMTIYKLLLSGLMIYFEPGTITQKAITLLIVLFAMWIQTVIRPFIKRDENILAVCGYWATTLTLIVGIILSEEDLNENDANMALLGAFLSIINLGLIGLAIVQLFFSIASWFYATMGFLPNSRDDDVVTPAISPRKNKKLKTLRRKSIEEGMEHLNMDSIQKEKGDNDA